MRRPNVVLLYTDQQRWDTIRAAGNEHIRTPNLDALATEGVLFENAFCNNPVCMPSRQSLLSGQYPSALGCGCNGVEMREDVPTLASILRLYGYHTANIGKLHFKNHANRDHREPHPAYGFDTLVLSDEPGCYEDAYLQWVARKDPAEVENCRCSTPPAWTGKPVVKQPRNTHEPYLFEGPEELSHTAFVAEETAEFIRQHRHEPFFVIAGFYAPHTPLNPPKRFVDLVDAAHLPLPHMNETERGQYGLSDADWRKVKTYYYALVMHVDDQVGRILAALDEAGLREETLVLFTSDHGEHLGDHGRIQKGPPGYDSCAHVPLLVRYPARVQGGRRFKELVEGVDVAPTILETCGVQVPPAMQGRSFRPLLEGGAYAPRESVFIEFRAPFAYSSKCVRTHTHKYWIANDGEERLFDLVQDPHELRDASQDPACQGTLHGLRRELLRRWFDSEKQYPVRTGQY